VLQQLEQADLAALAVSCNKLRLAVPENIDSAMCLSRSAETLESFNLWRSQPCSRLTNLKQCMIQDLRQGPSVTVRTLPLPNLDTLYLNNLIVQLVSTADSPGVLLEHTGLTALALEGCVVQDPHAAIKAIAALPQLQNLCLEADWDGLGQAYFADLQHPERLTVLSLNFGPHAAEELTQLSALSNLCRLAFSQLRNNGIPGGLPSQLANLRRLSVHYSSDAPQHGPAEQWQHLSALTALRALTIMWCRNVAAQHLALLHLSELLELKLASSSLRFNMADTQKWAAGLTALSSLTLWGCAVEA
jgi:hypothetical protein